MRCLAIWEHYNFTLDCADQVHFTLDCADQVEVPELRAYSASAAIFCDFYPYLFLKNGCLFFNI
jgi:hypothetical protein